MFAHVYIPFKMLACTLSKVHETQNALINYLRYNRNSTTLTKSWLKPELETQDNWNKSSPPHKQQQQKGEKKNWKKGERTIIRLTGNHKIAKSFCFYGQTKILLTVPLKKGT